MPTLPIEITCRGCALLCDDIAVRQTSAGLEVLSTCPQALHWMERAGFEKARGQRPGPSVLQKQTEEQGGESGLLQAQEALQNAQSPLFCGLAGLTLAAEKQAVELAENWQGTLCLGSSLEKLKAYQRYGGAACTLGEVRHRADIILCGNVDLLNVWSRFFERFLQPQARFLPADRPRKTIYLGETALLADPSAYDQILPVPAGQMQKAVQILRRVASGTLPTRGTLDTSLPQECLSALQELAEILQQAHYPVLFTPAGNSIEPEWTQLVQEMNHKYRLHRLTAAAGPATGNASETVLAMTGFPDAIVFRKGETQYDPDRFQPEKLLASRSIDLALYIGGELTPRWQQFLQQAISAVPVILIVEHGVEIPESLAAAIIIRSSVAGVDQPGTMLRADGVPLPLRPLKTSPLPAMTDLLQSLTLATP